MGYIEGEDRRQLHLLPDCIDDLVESDNPVRVIDAFVEGLSLDILGFQKSTPADTGRPAYDPRDLLKLYIYGYFNKIRSSRKLMKECRRNIEVFFLLNRLTPDFRTISDFRKENAKALRGVFKSFVTICLQMNLYERELFSIDGSKFRAVNSKSNSYNQETLRKKLLHIEENIAQYLKEMDQLDAAGADETTEKTEHLAEKIQAMRERKLLYQGYQKQLKESGEKQMLTTDPQARVMQSKDGFHCYYNVQTAIDRTSHLIAAYEVTNHCTDQGLLKEVAEQTREAMQIETISVVADKGYESRKDIVDCIENGIIPHVVMKYDKEERIHVFPYEESPISEEERHATDAQTIQKCIRAGVLPVCYENCGMKLDIQKDNKMTDNLSCFIRQDRNTVICPMGKTLRPIKYPGESIVYASKEACRTCTNRCTTSKSFKTVSFGRDSRMVPVKMYGDSLEGVQEIPEDLPMHDHNHTLDRKDLEKRKVQLRFKSDPRILAVRKCLSEHPFGTVKWYHNAHYLLCRGKEKASGELGLSFLVYNLKRAISLVGVAALIAGIQGI